MLYICVHMCNSIYDYEILAELSKFEFAAIVSDSDCFIRIYSCFTDVAF